MAAYAALVSLMNTIDHIQIHPRISNCIDKKQMESLSNHVSFLLDFVETTHSHGVLLSIEDEVLESQIASAAYAAEQVFESHLVDQIHAGSISLLDLQTVLEDMVSVKDKVVIVIEEGRFKDHQHGSTYSMPAPSISLGNGKRDMVGFDDELTQLLERLTGQQPSLVIIPIVGMGGIGKTTLAKNVYDSSLILDNFDFRGWATISQEYSVKKPLSKLVSCLSSQSASELGRENEQQLSQQLRQSLTGRRYLIILDDIWSIDVWEKIKFSFPDNNNGSRIILTTRLSNVASHFGSSYFSKKFLDEDESWKLFCKTAFLIDGCCPLELEEIGKQILKKCKGLPLLIVVIGRLLRKSSITQELWEIISKDINSIPNLIEEGQNLDILSLSYKHLPIHLKPCFLYTGIFAQEEEISVSHLIKLWVAEGFIKPNKTQSSEEVAESYLKDLVDSNLLLVRRLRWNGKIKTCTIHDLLRDLCIKPYQKEKYLFMHKKHRILRVDELSLVNCDPLLWNVQTLKVGGTERFVAPSEIWSMPQLRHVEFSAGIYLSEPPLRSQENDDGVVLKNLQTLKKVVNLMLSEEVCKRIPNVKKLTVMYEGFSKSSCYNHLCNIGMLQKLEILCCDFSDLLVIENTESSQYSFGNLLRNLKFPTSLKKLTLTGSNLSWKDLTMIGSLPNLEVLRLGNGSVRGSEWNPVEGEFLCLKYLLISSFELKYWNAESVHFPVLEELVLVELLQLDAIPSGVGEIPTLGFIQMFKCSESAAVSAMRILEEQDSLGNNHLRLHISMN